MAGLSNFPVAGVLRAEDFDRARKFYNEVLGLTERPGNAPGTAMFEAGAGTMVMIYESPSMAAPENTTLGFGIPVDAFDLVAADLRAKGVVFDEIDLPEMGIKTVNGIAENNGAKVAWFKDSEGNILNIATM